MSVRAIPWVCCHQLKIFHDGIPDFTPNFAVFSTFEMTSLYLAEVGGPDFADSANIGQQDLVAALRWVRDNISAFGGDPNKVLIFGQSGGGAKVSTLLAMPSAKGLFHRAIIQSGAGLRGGAREAANKTAETLLNELGLNAAQAREV